MTSSTAERSRDLTLWVLLPVAAFLRLRGLTREGLWLDEVNQLLTAAHPLSELGREIRWQTSPPLDYIVMHFWQFLGWSDAVVRLPAVAWSVGSVALLYLAVRQLGYERAALPAGLLLTFSLPSIAYAQEARMYSLFIFGSTALLYALGRLLRDPEARRGWALVGLSATIILYTHYYAAVLLVSLAGAVLAICVVRRSGRVLGMAIITGTTVALLFAPWLPILFDQYRIRQGALQYSLPREQYFETMLPYLSGGLEGTSVWVLVAAFLIGLAVVTSQSSEKGVTLAAFTVVPFLLAFWLPPFSQTITPRNLLFILPGYHVGIAVGLTAPLGYLIGRFRAGRTGGDTGGRRSAIEAVAGAIVVLAVAVWPTYEMLRAYQETGWWMKTGNTDWREAAAYVDSEARPGSVIVTDNRYTRYMLSFYLDPDALQGQSVDPYVQDPYHILPASRERFRVLTLEAPPALLRRTVQEAGSAWFVVPDPALEKMLGISGRARQPVAEGFDVPLVHLEGARAAGSLLLSRPPRASSVETEAGELDLAIREGWSSQFYLHEGVFLRWMGPRGALRLPVWSPLGTVARLQLFVPPELSGTILKLRAGDREIASRSLVPGWRELSIDLATVPGRRNWVDLWIDAARPPSKTDRMEIGSTGAISPIPIVAESSTHEGARFADIFINGELYSWFAAAKGYGRGYTLVAVDPRSGNVVDWAAFDTHGDPDASAAMTAFIDSLPHGTIVAGAVKDDGSSMLSAAAYRALRELGCSLDLQGRFRASHAFVGVKGAPPGTAVEDGLAFQGRVAVGADTRGFSIGLSSVEITSGR